MTSSSPELVFINNGNIPANERADGGTCDYECSIVHLTLCTRAIESQLVYCKVDRKAVESEGIDRLWCNDWRRGKVASKTTFKYKTRGVDWHKLDTELVHSFEANNITQA